MSAVPGAGEGDLHAQIAELSSVVYDAVCGEAEDEETGEEETVDEEKKGKPSGTYLNGTKRTTRTVPGGSCI
jgi:hypothetical protein